MFYNPYFFTSINLQMKITYAHVQAANFNISQVYQDGPLLLGGSAHVNANA